MTEPTADFEPAESDLKLARVEVLGPAIRKSMISSIVSVAVFGALLFPYSRVGLVAWLGIRAVTSTGCLLALKRLADKPVNPDRTITVLTAVMAISGVVWGVIPLLIRPGEPEWRAVVVLWLFGNLSVVTAVCSPSKPVFRAATGSVTAVGMASILFYGDGFSVVLAAILLLGGVYSVSIFGAMHQSVNSAIRGRLVADALATSLAAQQTELRDANATLAHLASHDELTGSLNRRSFIDTVADDTGKLSEDGWLGYLDIDHFKSVNDTYGHAAGDTVLQVAVNRWRNSLPANSRLSRLGGDEFVVWFHAASPDEARRVAEQLNQCLEAPVAVPSGPTVPVTCSIGVTPATAGEPYSVAAARADRLLYQVKKNGRNNVGLPPDGQQPTLGTKPEASVGDLSSAPNRD